MCLFWLVGLIPKFLVSGKQITVKTISTQYIVYCMFHCVCLRDLENVISSQSTEWVSVYYTMHA